MVSSKRNEASKFHTPYLVSIWCYYSFEQWFSTSVCNRI